MQTRGSTTQTMEISEGETRFSRLVDEVGRKGTRVLVEKSGTPVAALVSTTDLDRLAQFDRERSALFEAIDRRREGFTGVPNEEIDRAADHAVAELWAEAAKPAWDGS